MATLYFDFDGGGSELSSLSGTLTYSTSQSNTGVTASVSQITLDNGRASYVTCSFTVTFGGSTISSGTISASSGGTARKSISGSGTVNRSHSTTSSTLSIRLSGTASVTAGVGITIPAKPSYTVSYNANGGSSAPSSQTKWYGESLTLTTSKPYRSGYEFYHWNTSSSNGGTTYNSGASYTGNAALSLYAIWNPIISYNANGGSGAPASQTKTYGQSITLSSVRPQRTGYEFLGWGTSSSSSSASYQPSQTYTSNSSLSLYAVWRKVAAPPTISSMKVIRCNSSGTSDTSGEYCKVTATWSVDVDGAGMSENYGTVTGSISDGVTTRSFAITSGAGGSGITSATATAIVSECSTDVQYTVTITVTNNKIGTGQSSYLSTSRSDILTRAFFTLDFAAGGRGIGMGVAAPTTGFECGFDSVFNNSVKVKGAFQSPNTVSTVTSTTSDVLNTVSGSPCTITGVYVRMVGHLVSLHISATTTREITTTEYPTIATLVSALQPEENYAFVFMPYTNRAAFAYFSGTSIRIFSPFGTIQSGVNLSINATYCLRYQHNATI